MINVPISKLIIFLVVVSLYSAAAPVPTPAGIEAGSGLTNSIRSLSGEFLYNADDELTPVADMKMTCDECDLYICNGGWH